VKVIINGVGGVGSARVLPGVGVSGWSSRRILNLQLLRYNKATILF